MDNRAARKPEAQLDLGAGRPTRRIRPRLRQRRADVVVAVVGITSRLEGEEMKVDQPGFAGGDRTNLDMPKQEEDLVQALSATRKPLIVVLMNGSALGVNWEKAHANAILEVLVLGRGGRRGHCRRH